MADLRVSNAIIINTKLSKNKHQFIKRILMDDTDIIRQKKPSRPKPAIFHARTSSNMGGGVNYSMIEEES